MEKYKETIDKLSKVDNGIVGLLSADDKERYSYYLTKDQMSELYSADWLTDENVFFTPTDVRLENIKDDPSFYRILDEIHYQKNIIVFTHEWLVNDDLVKKYLSWFCKFSKEYNLQNMFTEDVIIN